MQVNELNKVGNHCSNSLALLRPLDINYVLYQGQGHGHLSKYLISGLIFHFFHVYMKKKLQTLL